MKCPKCGGEVQYLEDFTATGYYEIVSESSKKIKVKHLKDDDFTTDSTRLCCVDCSHEIEIETEIDYEN